MKVEPFPRYLGDIGAGGASYDRTIIIPAYNEEQRIGPTLKRYLDHFDDGTEIIVVLNGCRDRTIEVVTSFMSNHPNLRLIDEPGVTGKGGAVARGFIKAQGRIRTCISLPCVKCLEYFDLKINSRFDIILFPLELLNQKNTVLEAEEMEYIFYEEDQIDLTKILVEQINLFIPMYPQCHTGCRGICPNCGSNLNAASCQCEKPRNEIKFFFEKIKR